MIRQRDKIYIRKWCSLFSGKLFAMLVVYADETGTHGLQKGGREPAPGIYGLLATDLQWEKFRDVWATDLKRHTTPYFHFRDLHSSSRKKKGTPYFGWSDQKVDEFKRDMAIAASCGPIPVGGYPKEHPLSLFAKFSTKDWEDLINSLWAYKNLHESKNRFSGNKKPFYPYRDHPYLKAIYQSLVSKLREYERKNPIREV